MLRHKGVARRAIYGRSVLRGPTMREGVRRGQLQEKGFLGCTVVSKGVTERHRHKGRRS